MILSCVGNTTKPHSQWHPHNIVIIITVLYYSYDASVYYISKALNAKVHRSYEARSVTSFGFHWPIVACVFRILSHMFRELIPCRKTTIIHRIGTFIRTFVLYIRLLTVWNFVWAFIKIKFKNFVIKVHFWKLLCCFIVRISLILVFQIIDVKTIIIPYSTALVTSQGC